jgi:hypothetical protein
MKPDNKLVVVYETQGMIRAEIIKAKLESAGIPALLKYESLGPVLAVTVDGLGRVQVLVPQEREQEARELISESK